jgi:hypothetical protein
MDTLKLEDFIPGFKYQMKRGFSDGTVKTKAQFDAAPWEDRVYQASDYAYIWRMFNGTNHERGMLGLRIPQIELPDIVEPMIDYFTPHYGVGVAPNGTLQEATLISISKIHPDGSVEYPHFPLTRNQNDENDITKG